MCLIALGMVFTSCNNKQLQPLEEPEPKTEIESEQTEQEQVVNQEQ